MSPSERPSNDNGAQEWRGPTTKLGQLVQLALCLVVMGAFLSWAVYYLKPAQWIGVGITLAVAFVISLIAAIYRLIVHGRA